MLKQNKSMRQRGKRSSSQGQEAYQKSPLNNQTDKRGKSCVSKKYNKKMINLKPKNYETVKIPNSNPK